MSDQLSQESLIVSTRWVTLLNFLTALFTFAVSILVARTLHPRDYALYSLAIVAMNALTFLNDFGFRTTLIQLPELSTERIRQIFTIMLALYCVYILLLLLGAPFCSAFFKEPNLTAIIRVLSLYMVCELLAMAPMVRLTRQMRLKSLAITTALAYIFSSFTMLILAYLNFGAWSLIIGFIAANVVKTSVFYLLEPCWYWPTLNLKGSSTTIQFGGYTIGAQVAWMVSRSLDVFIISRVLGNVVLGYYSLAKNIANAPAIKIMEVITDVTFPAYSRIHNSDPDAARMYYLKQTRILAILFFPMFWGFSAITPEIVPLALGQKWLPSIAPMQILTLMIPLLILQTSRGDFLFAIGKPKLNMINCILGLPLMCCGVYFGAHWGLIGVSGGFVLAYIASFTCTQLLTHLSIALPIRDFYQPLLFPILISGLMYFSVYYSRLFWLMDVNEGFRLVELIVIGAVSYIGLYVLLQRRQFQEVLDFTKRFLNVGGPKQVKTSS